MSQQPSLDDRFAGCLLGLAVGDALGSHFEGQSPDWIRSRYPTSESLIANPPETPWRYTDDTQMAIGVSEALLKEQEFVEQSLCEAFVENYDPSRGYGRGARVILQAIEEGQDYKHWANELFPGGSFGNGAAMRVAPVGLLFHGDTDRLACPACGHRNDQDAKFCDDCGAAISKACPACGAVNDGDAKYCDGCGNGFPTTG